ncbi:MAG: B12-binding domain-containing radical SAM protein [Nanoarchaeota archaeon]|nr:B12-binding domain-containing radical SAM protein [Nanoarchaeota archaeon]
MKKILFVNPAYKGDVLPKVLKIPPLALATLASYTPDNYEMKIVDENVSTLNLNECVDLIAISSMTYNAPRAYEIAQGFRERGIPVVIGGIHPSMLPNEAIQYCDSVIIGEAESIWKQVIKDFENNKLQHFYYGLRTNLENMSVPRRDLFEKKYRIDMVQTSRGCPFNCEFCSVTEFNGGTYRRRPIKEVIHEIKSLPTKRFMFADDNIIGSGKKSEEYSLALFKELKEINVIWGSQASINIADNDNVLKAVAEAGGMGFFIGIESLSEDSLKQMGKGINLKEGVKNYKNTIKKLHDYGIVVTGAFVLGNDGDKKDIFQRTIDFIYDADIDRAQITISTPLPGTRLFKRLEREGRILYKNYPYDWRKYDVFHAVFEPKNMTIEELENGFLDVYSSITSNYSSLKRALRSLVNTKNVLSSTLSYLYNRAYGKGVSTLYSRTC